MNMGFYTQFSQTAKNAKYVQMYTVILTMGKSECMVR